MTDNRTSREIVEAARQRAANDPGILIQGRFARAKDLSVSPVDPKAECFCTLGLIANELGPDKIDGNTVAASVTKALGLPRVYASMAMLTNDRRANRLKDVKPKCPGEYVAGLQGFDYLLAIMP